MEAPRSTLPHHPAGTAPQPTITPSRKARISTAFARAAASYDDHAALQRTTAQALAARIATLGLPDRALLLEIGCGTGLLTHALTHALPHAHGLVTDLAPAMVRACRASCEADPGQPARWLFAAMDGEAPCLTARVDLVCASLAVQWFDNLAGSLAALAALLRPDGWLAIATLGPASLDAWRDAHLEEGVPPPTPDFTDPTPLAATWPGASHIETTTRVIAYPSGRDLLHSLRAIGAATPRPHHRPLRPGALRRVLARFERDHDATVRYQIIQLCLQAPAA